MLDPSDEFQFLQGTTDHVTDNGRTCWCRPRIEQLCPACRGDDAIVSICARCDGAGFVEEFTDDPEWPSLIVHRDIPIALVN